MEVLFKIIHFLWLASATFGFKLAPSLSIKTPVGLELGINGNLANRGDNVDFKSKSSISANQCFCLPKNTHSQPVINYLDFENAHPERKVIYLYKTNGQVKVYIPNEIKQHLIPELNFDDKEGDILQTVSSESIVELFNWNKFNENIVTVEVEDINETIDVEISEQSEIITNTDSEIITNAQHDFNIVVPSPDDNIFINDHEPVNIENVVVDNMVNVVDQVQSDVIINSEVIETEEIKETVSIIPPNSQTIINEVNKELDFIIESSTSDQLHNLNNNPNLIDRDNAQHIISMLSQMSHLNPKQIKKNAFYQWLQAELNNIDLYNLETPSKIIELVEIIIKVLEKHGMHLSNNGIVTDSKGNIVQMSNIILRPILVGAQIDARQLFNPQSNLAEPLVSYVLLIEIIQASPPKILSTVVMGTVHLPRKQTIGLWNRQKAHGIEPKQLVGCSTCNANSNNIFQYSTASAHEPIVVPYGQYHGVRFNIKNEKPKLVHEPPKKLKQKYISKAPYRQVVSNPAIAPRNGFGTVFNGLIDDLGMSQVLYENPATQLLRSQFPQKPKPEPISHPSDVFPGLRIIGGNAATSSGTPLANKGRSGLPSD